MKATLACAAAAAAFAVVVLTTDGGDGGRAPVAEQAALAEGPEGGRAVFSRLACGSCHRLAAAGSEGSLGPDLDERLPAHTRESLTAAILRPPPGALMPQGLGARMNKAEFDALLDFLLAQRGPR